MAKLHLFSGLVIKHVYFRLLGLGSVSLVRKKCYGLSVTWLPDEWKQLRNCFSRYDS